MFEYVLELINNGKDDIFIKDFRKIVDGLTNDETVKLFTKSKIVKIIINNNLFFSHLDLLSKKIDAGYIKTCIEIIYRFNKDYVINNKYKLFNYYFSYYFYREYIDFCIDSLNISIQDIINYIKDNKVMLKTNDLMSYLISHGYEFIVEDNIDLFINNSCALMDLKKDVDKLKINVNKDDVIDKINNRMDNNLDVVLMEIISTKFDYQDFCKEKIIDYLKRIIYEICKE